MRSLGSIRFATSPQIGRLLRTPFSTLSSYQKANLSNRMACHEPQEKASAEDFSSVSNGGSVTGLEITSGSDRGFESENGSRERDSKILSMGANLPELKGKFSDRIFQAIIADRSYEKWRGKQMDFPRSRESDGVE